MAANDPGQPPLSGDAGARRGPSTWPSPSSRAGRSAAHPDDVEFGAGGTLAKWAAAGCVVHHLVCTDGSKGTWDVAADLPALVARRQDEQREAARRLAGERDRRGALPRARRRRPRQRPGDRAPRSPGPSASCSPTSCSATTRGSATGCTPTTATPGRLVCDAHRRRPRPALLPRARHRPPPARRRCCCGRPTSPTTSRTSRRSSTPSWPRCEAHESQFETTMHAAGDQRRSSAFRERIRARLAELGAPHGVGGRRGLRPADRPLTRPWRRRLSVGGRPPRDTDGARAMGKV